MTTASMQQPMTEEIQRVALALADVERFVLDTRRASWRQVFRRVIAGRFVALVDQALVLPVLSAPTPRDMHAALDRNVERVRLGVRGLALVARMARSRPRVAAESGWERVLELVADRADREGDTEALAQLRIGIAAQAIAFRELRGVLDGRARVLDVSEFERATAATLDANVPLFAMLAWSLGAHQATKPEILEALGVRVVAESDAFSATWARAIELDAEG